MIRIENYLALYEQAEKAVKPNPRDAGLSITNRSRPR